MSEIVSAPKESGLKGWLLERNVFGGWASIIFGAFIAITASLDLAIGTDYSSWSGVPSGLGMLVIGIATLLPETRRRSRFGLMGLGFALVIAALVATVS